MGLFSASAQDRQHDMDKLEEFKKRHPYKYEQIIKKGRTPNLFDYLSEETSVGFSYNYGKDFLIGASFNVSYSMLMVSLDFGVNTDDDKYTTTVMHNYEDENNYSYSKYIRDPKYYMTITPHFYMKYFAIGCGVGFLELSKDGEYESSYVNGGNKGGSSGSSSGDTSYRLMIRPVIKGFIPINDGLSLSVNAGYDYGLSFKEKNGFNFGLGLQWRVDY